MRAWLMMLAAGTCGALALAAAAQQPAGKGPMLPPVNPALAKLDITISGLDGPGFGIAYAGDDSGLIVAGCERGTLQAFKKDVVAAFKGGAGKPEFWKGHQGPVRVVAGNGGAALATAGADKKINFWQLPDGKMTPGGQVDFRVRAGAVSNDGKTFAAAGEAETIQLFDVAGGKPTAKLADKMDWTLALAFSPDGKQLASGDLQGVVRLWDVGGAKKVAELPAKPSPPPKPPLPDPVAVTSLAFAPDGKSLAMGTADGPVHFLNLPDGKILRTLTGHVGPVTGIAFHPSGTLMATAGKDRTVKLWNPAAPQPLKSLEGHAAWVEGLVFIDQGTRIASVGADQTVRVWDLAEPPKKK